MGRKDRGLARVSKTDQRGRVGGWGTHFSQQAHQNYITCGTMLTENQLETGKRLLHNHGCRSHRESGRKRGAVIRPGLVPWEGTHKSPERSSLWNEWLQPHTGCPRKMRSPGWLEGRWYKQKGCGKPGLHSWGASTGLLIPEAGQRLTLQRSLTSFLPPPWYAP